MLRCGMMTDPTTKYFDLKTAIREIKKMGYECVDLSLHNFYCASRINDYFAGDDYKDRAQEIKELVKEIDLPMVQCHAPFPVHSDTDEEYNKNMLKILIRCIEICGIIGIPNIVIHPWNNFTDEQNVEFYKPLIEVASKWNVVICTENMWNWDRDNDRAKVCACSLVESFRNVIDGVNSPYLKACVDIGHAEMFSHIDFSPSKLLEGLGDRIYCLHIHDNDGIHDNHMIAGDGVIDYDKVIKSLKKIGYKYDLITETILPTPDMSTEEAVAYWKRQLVSCQKIKQSLLEK